MILYSKVSEHPDEEPVTLSDAKVHCRVDGSDEDQLIQSKMKTARRMCEAYAGLSFAPQTRIVRMDKFKRNLILPYGPVLEVTGFTYLDGDGVEQNVAAEDYVIDVESGITRMRPVEDWPDSYGTLNNVAITYTTGYAPNDVPEEVKEAILKTTARLYANRGDDDSGSVMTPEIMDLLDTVKVYWDAEY